MEWLSLMLLGAALDVWLWRHPATPTPHPPL